MPKSRRKLLFIFGIHLGQAEMPVPVGERPGQRPVPWLRQGPHQGAQKSTSTGTSERPNVLVEARRVEFQRLAGNSADLHLPQVPRIAQTIGGRRLGAWQCGQTTISDSAMAGSVYISYY
jgi:hypothetical protein